MKPKALSCTILLAAILAVGAPAWAAKVKVCHVPPGNPSNFHTITISDNALQAHLAHGDLAGSCFEHCDQLCNDGNACTIDACDANEQCAVTHPPVNCDDSNLCTVDSCNPATGCAGTPKSCSDGALCTIDACNPLTGDCEFASVTCPDGQTCNPGNGSCEGGACTPDPCVHGTCQPGGGPISAVPIGGSYSCICEPGWTGTNCEIDIDECAFVPSVCPAEPPAEILCVNSPGSYDCLYV